MRIEIDGKQIGCEGSKSIIDICRDNGIKIPHLCLVEGLKPEARCRICLVEMNGKLVTSCSTRPSEGCKILTNSEKVKKARAINAELLLPEHAAMCGISGSSNELCAVLEDLELRHTRFKPVKDYKHDLSESVLRDDNKCINCGKCVRVCGDIMNVYAIDFMNRGHKEHVSPYSEKRLTDVACIKCGQCIAACPADAIYEREHLMEVIDELKNRKKSGKHVVVQTAPSVRAALGEEFGMPAGTLVTGKMVSALRRCGFDKVFDTDLGADMTIMEEASEFLKRVQNNGPFPMITTCCPAWIKFMEHFEHSLIPNMSSCKSPHEMLGILTKTYYAKKMNIDPKKIVVVSVMPCTAKKFESSRQELKGNVDYVLTTREAAKLIRYFGLDFISLPNEDFDNPLGESTGAGVIFGASGGVMEAALRTAYEFATGKGVTKLEFDQIRGEAGIREGSIMMGGKEFRFAVTSGGANIRKLLKRVDKYHFIEMMACPGGCIGGGGQPFPTTREIVAKRREAIYREDANKPLRKSHENPSIKKIYSEFLGKPLSEKSEKLLHTHYVKREKF